MTENTFEQNRPKFFSLDVNKKSPAVLKVVGVGGGGCNAVESMIRRGLTGVEFIAINTDAQALQSSSADHKIHVGSTITGGLGAGADPNVGRKAVEEDREKIAEILSGANMVFLTTGLGGGTGTGGTPVVASIAKSLGALVVAIVTKPFKFEGKTKNMNAEQGILEIKQYVDSLIVIPNERLMAVLDKGTAASPGFDRPNDVLYEATRGIADIINVEGIINVDFADVRKVMSQSGEALIGCGIASGENRAIEAAQKAISSPLLEGVNIKGAKNILINVTGSSNLTINEMNEGNNIIYNAAGEEATVIFGFVVNEEMNDYVSYTVIATGFETNVQAKAPSKQQQTIVSKPKVQDPEPYTPGFEFGKIINQEDLEVPTIMRIKGTNASKSLEKNEQPLNSGFKYNPSAFRTVDKSVNNNFEYEEEDDTSSFLKMIMD
jgi:cell division protein FtsZ